MHHSKSHIILTLRIKHLQVIFVSFNLQKKTFITLTMLGESSVSWYHCHYLSDNKPKITQAACLLPLSSFNYRNGFCCFPFITIRKKISFPIISLILFAITTICKEWNTWKPISQKLVFYNAFSVLQKYIQTRELLSDML